MATIILGSVHVGFSMSSANQLATELNSKYGWTTDSEKALNQALVGSSIVVGLSCGALCGAKVIPIGRRKTMLIFNVMGVFGVAICMVENFYMLLLGRIIYGFAVGVESVAMPRFLDEVVPLRIYDLCIGLYVVGINVGYVFALDSAVLLPPDEQVQE
mmetsp:Transcript_22397/g.27553  ORF Transcript_22397/g.27553 Transcript_22397/m.27553 type:complete len:158 (+) Transcript_22397:138-611(+)